MSASPELVLPAPGIPDEIRRYGHDLAGFVYMKNMPDRLLSKPDYVMIKASRSDFGTRVKEIQSWVAESPIFMEVDWRFVVAGHLAVPLTLLNGQKVDRVQVMESKSQEGTSDYLGVEYASYIYKDFGNAERLLTDNKIDHELKFDGQSRWLNIPLNSAGQEVHITDSTLEQTLQQELETGQARYL